VGFSYLTWRRVPPVTHTDALFAAQSQSILDDLVTQLSHSRENRPIAEDPTI